MTQQWNDQLEARLRANEIARAKRAHPSYPYRARRQIKWRTMWLELAALVVVFLVSFGLIELAAWWTR